MRREHFFSSKRLIFLSGLLVCLGLLVLAWFQYRFLAATKSAAALALKGNLHQNAEAFSRRFEASLAEIDSIALANFPQSHDLATQTNDLKARFDLVRSRYPEITSLLLSPDCNCGRDKGVIVADSSGARLVQPGTLSENPQLRDALDAMNKSSRNRGTGKSHLDFLLVADGCSCMRTAGRMPYAYLIHTARVYEKAYRSTAVLAASLPPELFESRLFPEISAEIASPQGANGRAAGTPLSQFFFTVYSGDGTPVYFSSSSERGVSGEERGTFGSVLPGWEISAAYSGPDAEQMVSRQLRRSVLVFAFSFLVLATGMLLIVRAISMEFRNARLRDDFVANVSHEMKTPLAAIHMFSQTLELKRISTPRAAE
jgi:His Kinase A (phospho-acceptor) domain